jgi:hypothetical protein
MDTGYGDASTVSAVLLEGLVSSIILPAAETTSGAQQQEHSGVGALQQLSRGHPIPREAQLHQSQLHPLEDGAQQPCVQGHPQQTSLVLTDPQALAALGSLVQQAPPYTVQLQRLLGEMAWEELSLADVILGDPDAECDLPHLEGMSQLDLSHWWRCTLGQMPPVHSLGCSNDERALSQSRQASALKDDGASGVSFDRATLLKRCQKYAQNLRQRLQAAVAQWRSQSWEVMQPDAQRDAQRAALLQLLK